jgi:hypothetical protein
VGGFVALAWQAFVRKRFDALVIILWAFMPIVVLSFGSSKLYHYAYPFLPAYALAAGYFVGIFFALAAAPMARGLGALRSFMRRCFPSLAGVDGSWPVRVVFLTAFIALALFALTNLEQLQARDRGASIRDSARVRPARAKVRAAVGGAQPASASSLSCVDSRVDRGKSSISLDR